MRQSEKAPLRRPEDSTMTDSKTLIPTDYVGISADIVSAYLSNNPISATDVPMLIATVHQALTTRGSKGTDAPLPEELKPPVSIKKSITPDYLISMEDGGKYKTLKRHLSGRGLTPDEYRTKWNLPADYPMVAPAYAAFRSELAKSIGLGRKKGAIRPGKRFKEA